LVVRDVDEASADAAEFHLFMSVLEALQAVVMTTFSEDGVDTVVQTNGTVEVVSGDERDHLTPVRLGN
jgi:hypothetical protein